MTEVTILDWNILNGGEDRLDDIVRKIRDKNPDVVTLQECFEWSERNFEDFAEKIGLNHYAISDSPVYKERKGKHYAAIFSKYHLGNINRFTGLEQGVVGATIQFDSRSVRVYSVHLHHLYAEKRMKAFTEISKDAKCHGDVMIIGDYNSITESDSWSTVGFLGHKGFDVIEAVRQNYHDAFLLLHGNDFERLKADGLAHTYPSGPYIDRVREETGRKEPLQRIDYVFVSGSLKDRIRLVEHLRVGFSDHDPVYCVIDVGK